MRPEYANTFGLRKVANSSGELLEDHPGRLL